MTLNESEPAMPTPTTLTKTQVVLAQRHVTDSVVVFATPEEPHYTLEVDRDAWVDMGEPTAVTVTVEPGDLLNG